MRTLLDKIIIEKIDDKETTLASGIVLFNTESVATHPRAIVKYVGAGRKKDVVPCRVGDTILYTRNQDTEVDIDGQQHTFIKFQSVIAVI